MTDYKLIRDKFVIQSRSRNLGEHNKLVQGGLLDPGQ